MAISFTDYFGVDIEEFNKTKAFDVLIDVDSKIFIDPALIRTCQIKEFQGTEKKIEDYFSNINSLIRASITNGKANNQFIKKADKMLTFTEVTGTCMGYSNNTTKGRAIGQVLRKAILATVEELIRAGEIDPAIYELLGVFQENMGCDRISDLITFILIHEIHKYTENILVKFGLDTHDIKIDSKLYRGCVNEFNGEPILLLPEELLSPLPIAESFDDIDFICMENKRIRDTINSYFDLKNKKKLRKTELNYLIRNNSDFRTELLSLYKHMEVTPYDFESDPVGEYSWYEIGKRYIEQFPCVLDNKEPRNNEDVYEIALKICNQFKLLVEDNGLWELLYDNNRMTTKKERSAQLLFFGIADSYCTANNIDLTREPNAGRGPVDFKLSTGANDKVVVEVKLTSNSQLKHGIETQLPIYMKQEKTKKAIYLIIDNGHPKALNNFYDFYNELEMKIRSKIPFIVIDGTKDKLSASRA